MGWGLVGRGLCPTNFYFFEGNFCVVEGSVDFGGEFGGHVGAQEVYAVAAFDVGEVFEAPLHAFHTLGLVSA